MAQGAVCDDPEYIPKLTNFEINPVQGQKKLLLTWTDECKENIIYYEISRCEGAGCTNFVVMGVINSNAFEDASDTLEYGKTYTYKIESHYSKQLATPATIKTATLGDKECIDKQLTSFCLGNTPYSCTRENKLIPAANCTLPKICAILNNRASCVDKPICSGRESNPFGLLSDTTKCENNRYCFYDRSYSIVDSCFGCYSSMACYDYKSEDTCARDNCKIRNCKWKNLAGQIGIGVCVSRIQYNCDWCDKSGTASLENIRSYNEIFDLCTKEKSDALSEGNYSCYFQDYKSNKCSDIVCSSYSQGQCSNATIGHDHDNVIVNPSQDECSIKVCQNMNGACTKNADGDDLPDCSDTECEKDYFAPNTNLIPIKKSNATKSILVEIYDRKIFDGSYTLATSSNYSTFLCVEPCGDSGHPYQASTQGRNLIVSGLNIYDNYNGKKILALNEGTNNIRYYSQDPSKNIGRVKILSIDAFPTNNPPKVLSVNVTNGEKFRDKIFTNVQQPTITVNFFEPAVITSARLVEVSSRLAIYLDFGSLLSKTATAAIQQILKDGEYNLEINAKNDKNMLMDGIFLTKIVIDTKRPALIIKPLTGELLNLSLVNIQLTFDEEVNINSVTINSEQIQEPFFTLDNKIFTLKINLSDGNKILEVSASDYAKNRVRGLSSFIVDAYPTQINLAMPKFGVAPVYVFELTAETDDNSECGYNLDDNLDFDFMTKFETTGKTLHTTQNFNGIKQPDTSVHKLYVKCSNAKWGITKASFDLSVDTTPPQIKNAFAFPNPVIEKPMTTRFTVETDDLSICRYSTGSAAFDRNFETQTGGNNEGNPTGAVIKNIPVTGYTIADNTPDVEIMDNSFRNPQTGQSAIRVRAGTNVLWKYVNNGQSVHSIVWDTSGPTNSNNLNPGDSYNQQFNSVGTFNYHCGIHGQSMSGSVIVSCGGQNQACCTIGNSCDSGMACGLDNKCAAQPQCTSGGCCDNTTQTFKSAGITCRTSTSSCDPEEKCTGSSALCPTNINLCTSQVCGNGIKEGNEECDDSNSNNNDACTNSCKNAVCGDAIVRTSMEQCDNGQNNGACPATCSTSCAINTCTAPNSMEGKFEGYDNNTFRTINRKWITVDKEGNYTYQIACKNKAGLVSGPTSISFVVNLGATIVIISHTPQYFNTTTVTLAIETNKLAQCKYSETDQTAQNGKLFGAPSYTHTAKINSTLGIHTFYAVCKDQYLQQWSDPIQLNFVVDTTSPVMLYVDDTSVQVSPPDKSCYTDRLRVKFLAQDSESGVKDYFYTILRNNQPIIGLANTFTSGEWIWVDNLTLQDNAIYFFSVRARNFVGLSSNDKLSDGITIDTSSCGNATLSCRDGGTCKVNETCNDNSDCKSRFCVSNKCREATCNDGFQNQGESFVDCGGPCNKCLNGKSCRINSDCQSNSCNVGTCGEAETCANGKLDTNEADVDCGGPCPNKCNEGMSCNNDLDCDNQLKCVSAQCKKTQQEEQNKPPVVDSDGDGLPDDWEIQNGLNPNDPNDANLDNDKDGLTNREEYESQKTFGKPTDPNKSDTDGDGYSDKQEIDKGTNPLDSLSFPKSNLTKILLFILGAVVLISGFGYLAYVTIEKRRETEFEMPQQRSIRMMQTPQQIKRPAFTQRPDLRIRESLKAKEMQKDLERKNLFSGFGSGKLESKPQAKEQNQEKSEKEIESKKPEQKIVSPKVKKKPQEKQPKEDVFAKLKEISQETKKKGKKP